MRDRNSFIRPDLAQLAAYTSHSGGESPAIVDRLDTNESSLDLPNELKSKLAWAYQQEIEANRYPDGGHEDLKTAIAEYATESANLNQPLTTANVSVGNGSDELIRSILIATCLGGNGSILVATPTFSMYGILAKTLEIPVITVARDETDFSLDLDAAQQAIESTDNPPVRVVFMVHPNSPTGNALAAKELDWLRSLPEDVLIVIDEAYFEFSQMSAIGELAQHNNWVVLRTFSKAFRLAAHRVGYAIANPDTVRVLEKVRLPYNLPSFSQIAAKLALEQRKLLLPLVEETIAERKRVYSALQKDDRLRVWQSQANFLYLRCKSVSAEKQEDLLAQITTNLKAEGTLIRHTGGGLRITIGTPEESDRTLARLEQQLSILVDK
ncbi:MAG: histidinol-phosphate transaminase [Cyanobacteria bacterium P01_G01_bin.19]